MIDRRTFIGTLAGSLVATTIAAEAQVVKTAQIGFLSSGISSFAAPHGRIAFFVRALRDSLAELGYIENQNFTIEYRFAEEKEQRLPSLAAELVKHGVDVIVTPGPSATNAAKRATGTIPIVAIDFESDPVAAGFAASFARPNGNITGIFLDQASISGKWLELLKEAVPRLVRVAVLWDTSTPKHQLDAIKLAAKTLALTVDTLEVRGLSDFASAFGTATRLHCQGVVILSSPLTSRRGSELAAASMAKRLPTISMFQENVTEGCLISYGPNVADGYRRLGSLVGRSLKGAKPGDLPIEQPSKFELVINLKTAKVLGLTIPPSVLGRADQVIE